MQSLSCFALTVILLHQYAHVLQYAAANAGDECPLRKVNCAQFEQVLSNGNKSRINHVDQLELGLSDLEVEKCYVLVHEPTDYDTAASTCRAAGARLVQFTHTNQIKDLVTFAISKQIPITDEPSVWVGIESNGSAWWKCPSEVAMIGQDAVTVGGSNSHGHAAAMTNGSLLHFENKTKQLPFYCETNAPCGVASASCVTFHNRVQSQMGGGERVFSVPDHFNPAPSTGGSALSAMLENGLSKHSCYVLVRQQTDWTDANDTCVSAGGRLAWVPAESAEQAKHTLLQYAILNAATNQTNGYWIGQISYTMNETLGQWYCPLDGYPLDARIQSFRGVAHPNSSTAESLPYYCEVPLISSSWVDEPDESLPTLPPRKATTKPTPRQTSAVPPGPEPTTPPPYIPWTHVDPTRTSNPPRTYPPEPTPESGSGHDGGKGSKLAVAIGVTMGLCLLVAIIVAGCIMIARSSGGPPGGTIVSAAPAGPAAQPYQYPPPPAYGTAQYAPSPGGQSYSAHQTLPGGYQQPYGYYPQYGYQAYGAPAGQQPAPTYQTQQLNPAPAGDSDRSVPSTSEDTSANT